MKNEIPKNVVIGIVALAAVIAVIVIGSQFFGGGPGRMTDEEAKRADAQARVGTGNMNNYIPAGVPGAPPADPSGQPSGEAAARAAHAASQGAK